MLARDNTLNNKFFKNNDNGKFTFISNNPEKTVCLGIELGNLLQAGDLIAINGTLGAGKTSLIKGIAKGLKSPDIVTSPTFSIINEYSSTVPIFHFDLYRINKLEDIEELGYEEYFYSQGVTLIEWAEIIISYLPEELLLINIYMDLNNISTRKISFEPKGERYKKIVKELKAIECIRN